MPIHDPSCLPLGTSLSLALALAVGCAVDPLGTAPPRPDPVETTASAGGMDHFAGGGGGAAPSGSLDAQPATGSDDAGGTAGPGGASGSGAEDGSGSAAPDGTPTNGAGAGGLLVGREPVAGDDGFGGAQTGTAPVAGAQGNSGASGTPPGGASGAGGLLEGAPIGGTSGGASGGVSGGGEPTATGAAPSSGAAGGSSGRGDDPAAGNGPGGSATASGGAGGNAAAGAPPAAGGSSGPGGGAAASSGLRISELQTGSSASAAAEFIEIYSARAAAFDLGGLELVYRSATGTTDLSVYRFVAGEVIASHGHYLLIHADQALAASPDGAFTRSLAATGGGLALRDGDGVVVDSVGWGTATNAFVEGTAAASPEENGSLERLPGGALGNAQDSQDNAADFVSRSIPSPQGTRSAPAP